MAQGFYGADPEQLRALAKQFSTGSNQIRTSLETVSSLVNSGQNWRGPDASAFVQRWNSSVKSLGNTVVHALETESQSLIRNADEQTRASQADGGAGGGAGGGPGSNGGASASGPGGGSTSAEPGFFSKGSPFRDAWGEWGAAKNSISLPKNALGLKLMMQQGADAFYDAAQWKELSRTNSFYGALDDAGNVLGLKNLNQYVPGLKNAAGFFEETPLFFKGMGENLEALGKGGLGRTLGWAGVGLNAYDAVQQAQAGDGWGAAASVGKAALGAACFLPPPVGTVAQVGSVALAVYEIPAVKNFVDSGVKAAGDAIATSWNTTVDAFKNPNKFGNDVRKGFDALGKGASDFFGW